MPNFTSNMEAEGDFELREDELVDFEGSDYSLGFDDEFDEVGGQLTSTNVENIMSEQDELSERRISCLFFGDQPAVCSSSETRQVEAGNGMPKLPKLRRSCSQEGAESGEIKEEKEDGADSQTASSYDKKIFEDKGVQGRDRKHLRADLEDGELDDAAMPEASNYDGEGNIDVNRITDECIGHERKRKNFKDLAKWQTDLKGKEFMEGQSTASVVMQNSSRGRQSDYFGNFPKCKSGAQGLRMHRFGHPPPNLTPGIMDPTRPLMPSGLGGINQFGVPLGMCTPIQFQEALVQEQILISNHAFHHGVIGRGHPSFNMNIPPPHALGMDYFGPRPRGVMYIQPHGPSMVSPMNCFGAQRPIFRGRNLGRGSCTSLRGRGGLLFRNRSGRPDFWPLNPVDMPTKGRGRVQRHQVPLSIGHEQSKNTRRSQFTAEQKMDLGQEMPIIVINNADEIEEGGNQRWNPLSREDVESSKNTDCFKHQSNTENMENNIPSATSNSSVTNHSISNNRQASVEDNVKNPVSSLLQTSTINSHEGGSGATNMIKLGGPVRRSRVLSVRGLPEDTPLSIVIEAFKKQGKIMDVNKEERGDVFTITFSTLLEAISAKRLLHRSILGGKQITVDYSL